MMRRKRFPAARTDGLLVEQVGSETIVYETTSKEVHCLSPIASAVFDGCDGRTTVEGLAESVGMRIGEPVDVETVQMALAQLEDRNLLAFPMDASDGMSRRQVIRRGAAVAVSAPLITSVIAPPAIAAASATCANLLCCPCCTQSTLNKEECCTIPNVTVNCQCTNASRLTDYEGNPTNNSCAKYCKPSANAAPDDLECQDFFDTNADAAATCGSVSGFPTAGFAACTACAGCKN